MVYLCCTLLAHGHTPFHVPNTLSFCCIIPAESMAKGLSHKDCSTPGASRSSSLAMQIQRGLVIMCWL
jgi:hypothetical protein